VRLIVFGPGAWSHPRASKAQRCARGYDCPEGQLGVAVAESLPNPVVSETTAVRRRLCFGWPWWSAACAVAFGEVPGVEVTRFRGASSRAKLAARIPQGQFKVDASVICLEDFGVQYC